MSQKIQISQFKSSELSPEFNKVSSITIPNDWFAEGGFGYVYNCLAINDKPVSTPQAVKLVKEDGSGSVLRSYETLLKLQEQVIRYNQDLHARNEKTLDQVNALKALPQFSFKGKINQTEYYGYSANFLDGKTWCQFDRIFNDKDPGQRKLLRTTFYNLSVDNRLKIAHDLAEGFTHLGGMKFIYADLNPQNFFVDMKNFQLCLIDYEGGAVNDDPEVFGKPGEWLAPEIQEQLRLGQSFIQVDMNTDTWAVAIAIHFILFPFHPLFFLNVRGKNEMDAYLSNYQYPNIDTRDKNFRELTYYNWYLQRLKKIPSSMVQAFADTINNGYYNPNKRRSYKQWMWAIENVMLPPEITKLSASTFQVIKGQPINLSWTIKGNAEKLEFDHGIGDVTGKATTAITPQKNEKYTLSASNTFGAHQRSLDIEVLPAPKINIFSATRQKIRAGESTELTWEISNAKSLNVLMDGLSYAVALFGQKVIQPLKDTDCELEITALDDITVVKRKIRIAVFQPAKIIEFSADRYSIVQSLPVVLKWAVENATKVVISAPFDLEKDVTARQSLTIMPGKPTAYTLTAMNELFSASEILSIDVQPLPILPRLDSLMPTVNILPKLEIPLVPHTKQILSDAEEKFESWLSGKQRFKIKETLLKKLRKR